RSLPTTRRRGSCGPTAPGSGSPRRSQSGDGRHRSCSCADASGRGGSPGRIRPAVVWGRHHVDVPVGVVDVGSNTVRLLVSENGRTLLSERAMLRLGADIERHGEIPEAKLAQTAAVVAGLVSDARAAGVDAIEVLIA